MNFSDKLISILNHGAVNLALGLGYSLGIFEALDKEETPVTIAALARSIGLDARYLTEWMGIMVTAGIVEAEPGASRTYRLPKAHADLLCQRAGSANLGVYCQEIPLLTACAMEAVKTGFKTGEGIPFDQYPQFQAFMTELADAKHRQTLVKEFLPSVDQGRLVQRLEQGIQVLDLGCGQGTAVHLMAQAFPASSFLGIDIHGPAIEAARQGAARLDLPNASFEERDAARLEADQALKDRFHWICAFDAIHDQSHPLAVLRGVRHLLRPDGLFSMVDIRAESEMAENVSHPMAPFLYTVSLMHCMPIGRMDKGLGLGMMWGRQKALDLLDRAGFSRVTVQDIPKDSFNAHFLCRI